MDLVIPAEAGISCLCVQPGGGEMPALAYAALRVAGMTERPVGALSAPLQAALASELASSAISARVTCLWPTPEGART